MTPALLDAILAHARECAPLESCGLLVWDGKDGAVYHPCRNVGAPGTFQIDPEDWVMAEDAGIILGIVHSHPEGTTEPSEADLAGCDRSGLPWWIVVHETGDWKRYTPKDWSVMGHPFAWGVTDCFALARDVLGIEADFLRSPLFWESSNPFQDYMETAGFRPAKDGPYPGDLILMSIRGRGVANHCAVYRGEGRILHHLNGRAAVEENLGPFLRSMVGIARRAE